MLLKVVDDILCESVPQYNISTEREGVLQRARTLPEKWDWSPENKKLVRESIDKELETLRNLPPEKRTSVKGLLKPGGNAPETEPRK